ALLLAVALAPAPAASQQQQQPPLDPPPSWAFPNPRLRAAYVALQTWRRTAIFSDPANFTANWSGPNVCTYNGVFCAPHPADGGVLVVAGIDLNHADIAGYIPDSLPAGLPDLALLHLNSNRFCGVLPDTFLHLRLLHELDISNNRFVGGFPEVVLQLPSLRYLDLRFNEFEGGIPPALFDRPLDAIFLNSNRLTSPIPPNLGNSPASVLVLAHNRLGGCIPPSIGRMAETLNEIVLIDDDLTGCIPPQVGMLRKVTVFDVSGNGLQGPLPATVTGLVAVQELNVAGNLLEGAVPASVCGLPSLRNFTYEDNFFSGRPGCAVATADGRWNCIPGAPAQRPPAQCAAAAARPFDCSRAQCQAAPPPGSIVPAGLVHSILPVPTRGLHNARNGRAAAAHPQREPRARNAALLRSTITGLLASVLRQPAAVR
uniref:Cell wall hydroxyproline-rich glycoprotein n=1 Tax=Aegilops tauschii subsp. strangulata TaxID=200361 RepID=A0A453SNK1_AEGTS